MAPVDAMTPMPLLNPEALQPVTVDNDPLAVHRPFDINCPLAAWGEEDGTFEVQTGVCNYAAFDQRMPMPLQAGDLLRISVWHDFLDAPEPGEGHVAVWLGDTVLWDAQVAIPAPSETLQTTVELTETPPEGARLGVHLHNHGFNSWRLVSVDVLR